MCFRVSHIYYFKTIPSDGKSAFLLHKQKKRLRLLLHQIFPL